jgi:hypothetical protein
MTSHKRILKIRKKRTETGNRNLGNMKYNKSLKKRKKPTCNTIFIEKEDRK